jgi:hypothetical protein
MNYNIEENEKEIIVTVSVADRKARRKITMNTEGVKNYLRKQNINFFDCIKESSINNRHNLYSGVWIFSKIKKEDPEISSLKEYIEKNFLYPTEEQKITLDKPSTNVVKSRSSSNKKTKTRRKRKTTRKTTNK